MFVNVYHKAYQEATDMHDTVINRAVVNVPFTSSFSTSTLCQGA